MREPVLDQSEFRQKLRGSRSFQAFAMIVDISGFTSIVSRAGPELGGQFTRDVLSTLLKPIEYAEGEVVGFMGDAALALFDGDSKRVLEACYGIADHVDRVNDILHSHWSGVSNFWGKGVYVKILIEHGSVCS